MRLAADQREAVNEIIDEAHRDGAKSRDIAIDIIDGIQDLDRFGQPWTEAMLIDLAIVGAQKLAADWRRSHRTVTTTAAGSTVPLPGFAGSVVDGHHVQSRFASLDAKQLRAHKERLEANRNTLSKDVALVASLLKVMDADPAIVTAGQAEAVLREQAA